MLNSLTSLIILTLTMLSIGYSQMAYLNKQKSPLAEEKAKEQEKEEQIQLDLLMKMPDFGLNNLVADSIYLKFVQYYGDRARELTGYSLTPQYFQAFVDKDPKFIKPYFLFSPATTLFAGRPDKTVAVMGQGLKSILPQLPQSYQVWLYKGIDELLFVENTKQALNSYEMAIKWSKYHDTQESQNAVNQAQQTVSFLQQNPDSRRARAAAWMSILANAQDERVRQVALVNIERLGGKIKIQPGSVSLSFPKDD